MKPDSFIVAADTACAAYVAAAAAHVAACIIVQKCVTKWDLALEAYIPSKTGLDAHWPTAKASAAARIAVLAALKNETAAKAAADAAYFDFVAAEDMRRMLRNKRFESRFLPAISSTNSKA
mgnify:CR=1 FL=1